MGNKDNFEFKIEIKKTDLGYKDNIIVKGTELECLGSIEKVFHLLQKTKEKILGSIK